MRMSLSAKVLSFRLFLPALLFLCLLVAGCSNNPYPAGETAEPIRYRVLADQIRHMDPVNAYRVDEGEVIDNIYSSYFKYDYLKRASFVLDLRRGAAPPGRRPGAGAGAGRGGAGRK